MNQQVRRFQDRTVASRIRVAADLDSLTRGEIEELQRSNFGSLLVAIRAMPAVRARYFNVDELTGVDELPMVSLLTPAEFADGSPPGHDEFLLGHDEPGLVLRSSGTSGTPRVIHHSWSYNDRVGRLGARGVRAAMSRPPRRVANCMFAGELTGAFTFVQDLARLLPALVFPLGSRTPVADVAELISGHGIDTLVAGPAFATELITTHSGAAATLRTLLYLGEPMGAGRSSAVVEAAPELVVRSLAYSTSETGPIGYQCEHQLGSTHHVHEDAVVVEIVDSDTGTPVADGTAGEVVVTPLTDTGTALLRYRVGDRGVLRPEPCACGSAARLLTLLGRSDASITVDVTTISSAELLARLATLGVGEPADCQLQVLWESSTYRVRLLLSPRAPEGIGVAAVRASLQTGRIGRVLTNPRCTRFSVERVTPNEFARTGRDKVPVLYQRFDGGSADLPPAQEGHYDE